MQLNEKKWITCFSAFLTLFISSVDIEASIASQCYSLFTNNKTQPAYVIPDFKKNNSFTRGKTQTAILDPAAGYSVIVPRPIILPSSVFENPIVKNAQRPWNQDELAIARMPIVVSQYDPVLDLNSVPLPFVADVPIKFPHSEGRLPNELSGIQKIVQDALDYEKAINPDYDKFFIYLYVDQRIIYESESHRHPNAHVDGIQGREYPIKLPTAHAYLLSSDTPTLFFPHAFDFSGVDVNTTNFLPIFEKQADHSKIYQPLPGQMVVFDPYTVHASPIMLRTHLRTLVRIVVSAKQFDNVGNTHNPHFQYNWNMRPRPIHSDLK